jgi:hypothetical protein
MDVCHGRYIARFGTKSLNCVKPDLVMCGILSAFGRMKPQKIDFRGLNIVVEQVAPLLNYGWQSLV